MSDPDLREREDAFRTDVARLVQAMRHYLAAQWVPDEIAPLIDPVQHLGLLLDADAAAEHLREAALTVVDLYEWPGPDDPAGAGGPALDPVVVAALERLRTAIDAMDAATRDDTGAG
jgi:hypothetical protein